MSATHSIGQIIEQQWPWVVEHCNTYQIRQLYAIRVCRTPALGGHRYVCNQCGSEHYRYHSCRNRNCPQCQGTQKEAWIAAREQQLIHTNYYHVVFTLPHALNKLCLAYPHVLYSMLFRCAWQTLDQFGWDHKYLGAQIGATMVLHTWGSNLSFHPHVHCIVPGGGITWDNKWKDVKGNGKFLFPVKAMSKVFRGKFVEALKDFLNDQGMDDTDALFKQLYLKPWVVYAKPPFGGAEGVIRYLARYTHKTAITNQRIQSFDQNKVTFRYTDYRHANQRKSMTLSATEFLRRLTQHFLPHRFTRIRHYGILSSRWKNKVFPDAQPLPKPDWTALWLQKGLDLTKCPTCKTGTLVWVAEILPVRGPPPKSPKSNEIYS